MPFEWHFGIMSVTLCCSGLVLTAVAVGTLRPLRGSSWPGAKPETGWFSRLHARYRRIVDARAAEASRGTSCWPRARIARRAARIPCSGKSASPGWEAACRWLGSRPVALFFIVFLGCYLFDVMFPWFRNVGGNWWRMGSWDQINGALRSSSAMLAAVVTLPITRRGRGEHHLRARAGHVDEPGDDPSHAARDHPRQAVGLDLERALGRHRALHAAGRRAFSGRVSSARAAGRSCDPFHFSLADRRDRGPRLDAGSQLDPCGILHLPCCLRLPVGHVLADCFLGNPGVVRGDEVLLDRAVAPGLFTIELRRPSAFGRGLHGGLQLLAGSLAHGMGDQAAGFDVGTWLIRDLIHRSTA